MYGKDKARCAFIKITSFFFTRERNRQKIKKGIFKKGNLPRLPILINLKSNTMKNMVQR